jgi:hypothetical protein
MRQVNESARMVVVQFEWGCVKAANGGLERGEEIKTLIDSPCELSPVAALAGIDRSPRSKPMVSFPCTISLLAVAGALLCFTAGLYPFALRAHR